jgi:hypothetical protein
MDLIANHDPAPAGHRRRFCDTFACDAIVFRHTPRSGDPPAKSPAICAVRWSNADAPPAGASAGDGRRW